MFPDWKTHRFAALLVYGVLLIALVGKKAALFALEETEGKYITRWLVCGPFPLTKSALEAEHLPGFDTDFLASMGGEANPQIRPGRTIKIDGQELMWREYESPTDMVSLDESLSRLDYVTGYAYTELSSEDRRLCLLGLRTNDGGRLWINGKVVWDYKKPRGLKGKEDLLPIALQKGKNTILLKVEERANRWEFMMRILPLDVKGLAERFSLCSVQVAETGVAQVRFFSEHPALKELVGSLQLTLRSAADGKEIWNKAWKPDAPLTLDLPDSVFRPYSLNASAMLEGNIPWSSTIRFAAGNRMEHVLFDSGKTDYVIALPLGASTSEQWAAKELQYWLKEISGAELPIVPPSNDTADRAILVGYSPQAAKCLPGMPDAPPPSDESFTYGNAGPTIAIVGGRERGTLYGVMTFLEKEFGVRWYTPRVTNVPKKSRFPFTHLFGRERPGVRVRNDFYFEAFDPTWAARNKMNGRLTFAENQEQPGGVESYWSVHTFYPLMPPKEFFNSHPEYYSLIEGRRTHERAQLCLTHPEVLRIVTERIKERIRQSPKHLIYDVSQNDWHGACQCDACQTIARREESESGPLIWFVNQVAEALEREFPDKFIGTLAYQYTRKPCKTLQLRRNVVVRLCSIECCFAHDFTSCPENRSFMEDLRGWAKIAPHLYIWDYVVNFSEYIMPYPNFGVLRKNIQTLRDHRAIGIMEQAAYQSRGGEFAELRAFLLSRLLWNPEANEKAVIDDFMAGYYGRAGQYVKAYFDLLHARVTPDTHIYLGLTPEDKLFSDEFILESGQLFDHAETVAETEEVRRRVEMARLPILYLKCLRNPVEAKYDGTYARFSAIAAREGISHYAEAGETHRQAFHQRVQSAK